jgi:hypothetical protein
LLVASLIAVWIRETWMAWRVLGWMFRKMTRP